MKNTISRTKGKDDYMIIGSVTKKKESESENSVCPNAAPLPENYKTIYMIDSYGWVLIIGQAEIKVSANSMNIIDECLLHEFELDASCPVPPPTGENPLVPIKYESYVAMYCSSCPMFAKNVKNKVPC